MIKRMKHFSGKKDWENWDCSGWRREGFGVTKLMGAYKKDRESPFT